MDKLISIIIPVYNVEKYLADCLESLAGQSYEKLEIILIDDGSTDKSGEICDSFAARDSRFKVIHTENRGVNASRNAGLRRAKGEYIGFADANDVCAKTMFEYLLTNAVRENADITCCRYYRVKEGKQTSSRCSGIDVLYNKQEAMAELINHFIIRNVLWNKLFKREILEGFTFNENRIHDGVEVVYALIEKSERFLLLGDPKYYYYKDRIRHTDKYKYALDYCAAHIVRYENLKDKYPLLRQKMLIDIAKAFQDLEKVKVSEEEKLLYSEENEIIRLFKENNDRDLREAVRLATGVRGPLVSIIIPVYGVESFLRRCLDTVINQTYADLEIILVDDGSPDKSGAICDEYALKDSRIKVIHQENKGLCGARNAGLEKATGAYIGFIDSDDWIAPDMYEYLVKKLEKYNADIVSCQYYRVIAGKNTKARCDGTDKIMNRGEAIDELVSRFTIRSTFWNKLFRREFFDSFRFPEGRTYEGTLSMHKIFEKADRIVMLGDPKYYYFDNETSIINTKSVKNAVNYALSYIERYEYLINDYPNLKRKMVKDAVSAVRKLRYVCSFAPAEELSAYRAELERIRDFLENNLDYIFSSILRKKSERKEIENIMKLTPAGFRRAHDIAAIDARKKKLKKLLKRHGGGKKKKSGNVNTAQEMTPEREEKLNRLHMTLMEILDVIDKICRENGLKYYLYGGTLLGAVRHKGIIPWDDDMDIVMYRKDFEKFAEICKTQLPDGYFYQTCFTDPDYPHLMAKIRKDGTFVREAKWDDRNLHKGIFVDILPLDHFPENQKLGSLYLHMASFMHQVCSFKYCHSHKLIVRILFKLAKLLPIKTLYRIRDRVLKSCNKHGSEKLICSFGSHYKPMIKRVLQSEWFGDTIDLELYGKKYMAAENYEGYLLHLFGPDYMTLPPMNKRICHGDLDAILFGDEDNGEKQEENK